MFLLQRLPLYLRLTRLDKPIGILLLLWPTLWALWIAAGGHPPLGAVAIFVIGTVLMRSAGCVMNDYADRDFDPHVKRTRDRPLASRAVSGKEALAVTLVLVLASFVLILPLNRLTLLMSVPALFLAGSYPLTKRFLAIPQAYLGIAFGFGIPMSYAAMQGRLPAECWLMLLANIFWAVAYDTEYAMVDRDDDIHLGIRSSALTFGRFDVAAVMLCQAAMLGLMAVVGRIVHLGALYYAGLAFAALLAAWQYRMIKDRERMPCFRAFLHNNWVGAAIFAGTLAHYLANG